MDTPHPSTRTRDLAPTITTSRPRRTAPRDTPPPHNTTPACGEASPQAGTDIVTAARPQRGIITRILHPARTHRSMRNRRLDTARRGMDRAIIKVTVEVTVTVTSPSITIPGGAMDSSTREDM